MSNLSTFVFNQSDVRVLNIEGEPWFVAKDVLEAMKSSTTVTALRKMVVSDLGEEFVSNQHLQTEGGIQEMLILSEPGLTLFISRSRTQLGKEMNRWIHVEVLPSIRKTGKYEMEQKPLSSAEVILAQAQQLVLHEQKIKGLEIEQKRQAEELKLIRESEEATAELAEANADELSRFKNGHGYWHSVVGYCSTRQIKDFSTKQAAVWGRKATALCKKSGITPEKVNDAKYGSVNVYPDHILDEIILV